MAFGQASPNFYATWLSAQEKVHPALTGGASVAIPLDKSGENYSFTSYNIAPVRNHLFSFQTTVTSGIATQIKKFGPVKVFAMVYGGVSTVDNAAGGAVGGKVLLDIPIGKSPYHILIAPSIDKTSTASGSPKSLQVGIGRTF